MDNRLEWCTSYGIPTETKEEGKSYEAEKLDGLRWRELENRLKKEGGEAEIKNINKEGEIKWAEEWAD